MVLISHAISLDHVTKGSRDVLEKAPHRNSPLQLGDHRHCGNRDILVLVVEEQDFTCSLNSAITIVSKARM